MALNFTNTVILYPLLASYMHFDHGIHAKLIDDFYAAPNSLWASQSYLVVGKFLEIKNANIFYVF